MAYRWSYNYIEMKRTPWLILFTLLLLILLPPLLTGFWHLRQAAWAASPAQAADHLEAAARLLPGRADLLERAGVQVLESDPLRAIALLLAAREKQVLSFAGQVALGDAYALAGDESSAVGEWLALFNAQQALESVSPRLAERYHATGQYPAEAQVLRAWLVADPQNGEASGRLGLLLAADSAPESRPLLERAVAYSPEQASRFEGLLAALGDPLLVGQELARLGEWRLAESAFDAAVGAAPQQAEGWAWLGLARQMNVRNGALEAFKQAVALEATSAQYHAMLGSYLLAQLQVDAARAEFETAVSLEPQNPAWYQALGSALARTDVPAALAAYLRATELSPSDANNWYLLAAFCVENDVYIADYGLSAALRAYALDDENVLYLDVLGRALAASGEWRTAEEMYLKAIAADPQAAGPLFHLGLLYLQTARDAEAKARLEQVIRLDLVGQFGPQARNVLDRYFP